MTDFWNGFIIGAATVIFFNILFTFGYNYYMSKKMVQL